MCQWILSKFQHFTKHYIKTKSMQLLPKVRGFWKRDNWRMECNSYICHDSLNFSTVCISFSLHLSWLKSWLLVLGFNTTLTAKVISWRSVTHVFPGFLTPVLTQLFFPKPPTTFLTCFWRGEGQKYAGKKSRLNRGSNSQPPGHESDTLTTEPPGLGCLKGLSHKQEGHDGPVSLHWLIREIHSYQTLHYLGIGLKPKAPYKD